MTILERVEALFGEDEYDFWMAMLTRVAAQCRRDSDRAFALGYGWGDGWRRQAVE